MQTGSCAASQGCQPDPPAGQRPSLPLPHRPRRLGRGSSHAFSSKKCNSVTIGATPCIPDQTPAPAWIRRFHTKSMTHPMGMRMHSPHAKYCQVRGRVCTVKVPGLCAPGKRAFSMRPCWCMPMAPPMPASFSGMPLRFVGLARILRLGSCASVSLSLTTWVIGQGRGCGASPSGNRAQGDASGQLLTGRTCVGPN